MKAAICQKHCEKLWGIHWKQMGFFSFNSEILSLSGTIKTNRGATQNVIKQKLTRLSLCPWASPAWASVGAGRGGRGLVWDLPSAPSSTPGQPTGLQTGGRGAGESAPGAQSEPLLLLSFGAPKRRPGHPFSRKKGGREASPALQISPIRSRSSELGQEFPHLEVSSDIHSSLCRARDKDPWQWESGSPGGGGESGTPTRAGKSRSGGPGRLCLTCGEAAEKDGEGRPQSQG